MTDQTLILWDSSVDPSEHTGRVYRWNGYSEKSPIHSLLRYVEAHGDRLRRKYLAWTQELGESRTDGRRLIDHFAFEDGLSYWWMTLFVAQSFHSLPIADALRLLAFDEIVVQQRPKKITLVSAKCWLHETISDLCRSLEIDYEWEKLPSATRPLSRERIYQSLPEPFQALLSVVRHLRVHWPFRRALRPGWSEGNRTLFFCGYFVNVVPEDASEGKFHSRYWEGLHGLTKELGFEGNWLHHNAGPGPEIAMGWVRRFNGNAREQGFHVFLDAYLSWRIVFRVIRRWLWLTWVTWRLGGRQQDSFRPQGCHVSFWPLTQGKWMTSLRGSVAISNLLSIELFDAVMSDLPHQKVGFYLCENYEWERALIHSWRKHGHGQLIAVAHSTVRFWDLRYFMDIRILQSGDPFPIPQPDLTVLNGRAAMDAYLDFGYPKERIIEGEALRYGYLNDLRAVNNRAKTENEAIKILILGELSLSSTVKLLRLIEATAPRLADRFTYTVKPHPVCPVNPGDFPGLGLTLVTNPLGKLLQHYDIVCSSNSTSAAVDAYVAGLPVIVMLDDTDLNFSPLRGQAGIRFVSTPEELAEALQAPESWAATNPDRDEFFFLDPKLPRWRQLLLSSVPTWMPSI